MQQYEWAYDLTSHHPVSSQKLTSLCNDFDRWAHRGQGVLSVLYATPVDPHTWVWVWVYGTRHTSSHVLSEASLCMT